MITVSYGFFSDTMFSKLSVLTFSNEVVLRAFAERFLTDNARR